MIKRLWIYVPALWLLLVFISIVAGSSEKAALASVYGGTSYGKCAYVSNCPSPVPSSTTSPTLTPPSTPTDIEASSGAHFTVNLQNGQLIPASGYTIIVSQATGENQSIIQVVFSIEGHTIQTQTPDPDGVVRWFWGPKIHPGTHVTVTVTDQKNEVVAQSFIVSVLPSTGTTILAPTQQSPLSQASGFIEGIFIVAYKPVLYLFPYLLFGILAINGVLLLMQERRELSELHTLQADSHRIQLVTEQKNTFIALASHYLRTPLTVMLGGLELVQKDRIDPEVMQQLEASGSRLHAKVESLLDRTMSLNELSENSLHISVASDIKPWKHPAIFLPIVLLGGIALLFNFFAERSAALTLGQTTWVMQWLIFVCIALVTFLIFRHFQLGLRDRRLATKIVQAQTSVIEAQDAVIATSVTELTQDLYDLARLLSYIPVDSARLIRNGCIRFKQVLDRFAISMKLKGGKSSQPYRTVTLHDLLNQAKAALGADERLATARLLVDDTATINTRNPALLVIVLTSLLDNALAYSTGIPLIEIACQVKRHEFLLTVSDQGKGISQAALVGLFRPFTKVEGAEDFTHEGMGFSLYLDKLIMSYLGGDITLHSKPGSGTTVKLYLPKAS